MNRDLSHKNWFLKDENGEELLENVSDIDNDDIDIGGDKRGNLLKQDSHRDDMKCNTRRFKSPNSNSINLTEEEHEEQEEGNDQENQQIPPQSSLVDVRLSSMSSGSVLSQLDKT